MSPEKRVCERSAAFLIVEFKPLRHTSGYSIGVMNNCSHEGFNFESHYHDLAPGKIFEFNLKHPSVDLSVTTVGEIVWKKEAWYSRVTGVKLRDMDQDVHEKISELLSSDHGIPDFPSILPEKSEAANDEKGTFEPEESTEHNDNVIFDSCLQDNDISPTFTGESSTAPSVSDSHLQCESSNETVHHSATPDYTVAVNGACQQKSYLRKSPLHNGSLFPDTCKAVIDNTLVSLRNSNDRSWLHLPLALIIAGIAIVVLSIEFDLVRLEASLSTSTANTMLPKSHYALPDHRDDESSITCEQESYLPGTSEMSQATGSEEPAQILAANVQQSPDVEIEREDKNYFVQVGAWKNIDYAKIMLAQLQTEYPLAHVMPKNNFQIILIPNLESKIQGLNVSKVIKSKYDLNPVLLTKERYAHSPASLSKVSKQPKRRIKPKSVYKIKPPVDIENKIKEREILISQKNKGNLKKDFNELPQPVSSPLRNQFMIRTMHRNPDLLE